MTAAPKVRDLMTRDVLSVAPETSLEEVSRLFLDKGISAAPVVGRRGEVLGIVTKTDIGRAEACGRHLPEVFYGSGSKPGVLWEADDLEALEGLVAGDVMTPEPRTIPADAPASAAAQEMETTRTHHLLVVEGDELVGVLSSLDLAGLVARHDHSGRAVDVGPPRPRAA